MEGKEAGEEAVAPWPFCLSRDLLAMRMKLRVPHGQQGGALAFVPRSLRGVGAASTCSHP